MYYSRKLAALGSFAFVSLSLFSGCPTTNDVGVDCGPYENVASQVVVQIGRNYRLETGPVANGSQFCEATFHLYWRWADTNRAKKDGSMPPLYDLKSSFHVNSESLVFSSDTPAPKAVEAVGPNRDQTAWEIQFSDHNVNADTVGQNYFIHTWPTSNNPADSVYISGQIFYYKLH